MSAARLFILVIAAIAAIVLAFVVRGAFAPKKAEPVAVAAAAASKPMTRVLVAKRDLPIGTRLVAGDMGWQDWPAESLNPVYITDGAPPVPKETGAKGAVKEATSVAGAAVFGDPALQSFVDAVVREPFLAGEPIVARKTIKAGEGNFMAIVLAPGKRAMALPVSVDSAAGGFIMPGDRVDVLFSKNRDGDKGVMTRTVLRNIRVLAIDQTAEAAPDVKALVGAVATLEVAAGDIEVMAGAQAEAKAGGNLSLALRSYADAAAPSGRGGGGSSQASGVRVHRAGQVSEVMATQ